MTEREWLNCAEPRKMLAFAVEEGDSRLDVVQTSPDAEPEVVVVPGWATERRIGLLACAGCGRNKRLMADSGFQHFVELFEKSVDGQASSTEAHDAGHAALRALGLGDNLVDPQFLTLTAIVAIASRQSLKGYIMECVFVADIPANGPTEDAMQCGIVRDIFGNPFRQLSIDAAWLTPQVVSLAQHIYNTRAFDLMLALGAGLSDAGCTDPEILGHCVTGETHCRGCWLVDLLLKKS